MLSPRLAALMVISLGGIALAGTRVARQGPEIPASIPVVIFITPVEVEACASVPITWNYAGPDEGMTLSVTNVGVDQIDPPTLPSTTISHTFTDGNAPRAVPTGVHQTTQVLATIPALLGSYNWTQVALSKGWYQWYGSISLLDFSAPSNTFYVREGNDISCLSLSTTILSQPATSSTISSTSTTSSTSSTSTSSTSPPSQTAIAATSVNKGAIAGGVVGGVALLLVVFVIYILLLRAKRGTNPGSPRFRDPGSITGAKRDPPRAGGWGGLSSVDSHRDLAATHPKRKKPYSAARHSSQAESIGPMIAGGTGASQDDIRSYRAGLSPSEEKSGAADDAVGLTTLPPIGQQHSRSNRPEMGRSYSTSTFNSLNDLNTGAVGVGRRPSISSSGAPLPPGARHSSIELPAYPPSPTGAPPYAPSPSPIPPSAVDRTASGSSQPQRKTPRKPVPAYDSSASSTPTTTTGPPTPVVTSPFDDERGQRRASGGHYGMRYRNEVYNGGDGWGKGGRSGSRDRGETAVGLGLSHKSSFGPGGVEGKPLHYLIPDMPPPPIA